MEAKNIKFLGVDEKIQKIVQEAKTLSVSKAPVLITGENGVGKKTFATYIHHESSRAQNIISYIDCSLPPQEVENAVLGYRDLETGRFHKGVLEVSNRGTVVFMNIESLSEDFQKRLTKILSELSDYDIDVRLIATTCKNLAKLVSQSRFFRSLFLIFSPNTLNISPLRERPEDLVNIINFYVSEINLTKNDEEKIVIDEDGMKKLMSHNWNGNINEVKNILINGSVKILDEENQEKNADRVTINLPIDEQESGLKLMSLRDAEELLIKKALIHTSENRTQAAKILGVSIRTLRNKINEYRVDGSSYFINLR